MWPWPSLAATSICTRNGMHASPNNGHTQTRKQKIAKGGIIMAAEV